MYHSMPLMSALAAPVLASSANNPSSPLMAHPSFQGDGQLVRPTQLLVTMVPDDSGSINHHGNAPAIRRGHNSQLDTYRQHPGNILVRNRYLNGTLLYDFSKPEDAIRMDTHNYNPNLGTPLYDETYRILLDVERSLALYTRPDLDVVTMTAIMTDGHDQFSRTRRPADVRTVVERMITSENHIVAGIGVRDGYTNFARVFAEMGIPEQWIIVLEREEGDIVRGMTSFAQTTRGVTNRQTFTQTSMGGFGPNPTPPSSSDT